MKSVREGAAASSAARSGPKPTTISRASMSTHRLEQHLHALLLDQLPEVNDERPEPVEKAAARRCALPSSGRRSSPPFGGSLRGLCEQVLERCVTVLQNEPVDVHPGRNVEHAVSVANHVCEHFANVLGADVGRVRARKSFPRPLAELGAPSHRVLELGAVCLHAEGGAAGRSDGPAHQHVIGEHEIGRQQRAKRSRVRFDVRTSLGLGEVLEELRLEPLVPVHDEDGQQPPGRSTATVLRAAEVVLLRARVPARRRRRRVRRGSTHARARASRHSTRFLRGGNRARARCARPDVTRGGNRARGATRRRGSRCAPSRRPARRAGLRSS